MLVNNETLVAYLDGQLSTEEMDRITDLAASSPDLAAELEVLRAADARLAAQFAAVDQNPIRQDTLDLIKNFGASNAPAPEVNETNIVALKPRNRVMAAIVDNISWGQAIAASIVLVVGIGTGMQLTAPLNGDAGTYAALQSAGLITPASPLYDVLENKPSLTAATLAGANGTVATPIMSFRAKEGTYCREFIVISGPAHSRNVACRANSGWLIKIAIATAGAGLAASVADGFVPASSAEDALMDNVILDLMVGDALDGGLEKTLIDRGWNN